LPGGRGDRVACESSAPNLSPLDTGGWHGMHALYMLVFVILATFALLV
jgi:hypothetical protein